MITSRHPKSPVLREIGVAALSLSSLCFYADGAEAPVETVRQGPQTVNTPADPLLSSATRYMRESLKLAKPIGIEMAGVSLESGSAGQEALSRAASIWLRGGIATKVDVLAILAACTREPGSEVNPDRIATILTQHIDFDVQRAVLRYLFEKPDYTASSTTLRAFLQSKNPELVSLALLVQSKEVGKLRNPSEFDGFIKNPDPRVRQAAAIAMMSAGVSLPQMSAFDCFSATKFLQFNHYEFGFEARLANAMESAIKANRSGSVTENSAQLELPLIHLLQRIDAGCPGYLEAIDRAGSGSFERFCDGLLGMIVSEREAIKDRVIVDSNTTVLVAMHQEEMFSPDYVVNIGFLAGVSEVIAIKEQGSEPSVKQENNPESNVPEKQEADDSADTIKVPVLYQVGAKKGYLELVPELLRKGDGSVALFHSMHGGYNSSYLSEGTGESIKDSDLRSSVALSYEEIAELLFTCCGTADGTVECGRITIFLDACYQYTVAEQIQSHLEILAQRSGKRVTSYPLVTSLSQPLMYSSFAMYDDDFFAPSWFGGLAMRTQEDNRLTVSDLLAADEFQHRLFDEQAANPKSIRPGALEAVFEARVTPDRQGLSEFNSSAPAVFGPRPVNIRQRVREIIEVINQDSDFKLPEVPADAQLPERTFLEIG